MSHYPTDHSGLEILPFGTCLELLAKVPVGRVSFFADGEIVTLPVNHALDGQVYDQAEITRLSRLGVDPWVHTPDRSFWIRITPSSVTGRRTILREPAEPG
jgi:hypothetical protein